MYSNISCKDLFLAAIFVFAIPSVLLESLCDVDVGECEFPKHNCEVEAFKSAVQRLSPLLRKSFSIEEGNYTYDIGICKLMNPSSAGTSLQSAAVVQTDAKTLAKHSAGNVKKAEIMGGTNYIYLEYEEGDAYKGHCGFEPRRSIIMIICKPGETEGKIEMIGEENMKAEDCYYLFELEHEAACSPESSHGLSIGSIVCIVFFTLVLVYLLGGFVYQRFVKGAKGMEQIPHYSFWQDFGNLQADGCDFIFRSRGSVGGSKQYRGIGDDQLQTTEEDGGTDEHLLPM